MAMTDREENYETVELCLGCGREGCESCPCGVYTVRRKKFRLQPELEKFPELGRIVPERNQPNIREIVVKNYRLVYRVHQKEKCLEILRVWHGARGEPEI